LRGSIGFPCPFPMNARSRNRCWMLDHRKPAAVNSKPASLPVPVPVPDGIAGGAFMPRDHGCYPRAGRQRPAYSTSRGRPPTYRPARDQGPRETPLTGACLPHPRYGQLLAPTGACRACYCAGTNHPAARHELHNDMPGNPRGTPFQCTSPRHDSGRRRTIGGVEAPQSAFSRPRRWCDAREPPYRRRLRRPALRDAMSRGPSPPSGTAHSLSDTRHRPLRV